LLMTIKNKRIMGRLLLIILLLGFVSVDTIFAQKLAKEFVANRGGPVERDYYLGDDRHRVIMRNQSTCYPEEVILYKNGEKIRQYHLGEGFVGDVKFLPNGPELIYIGIPSDYSVIYGLTRVHYNFDGLEINKENIPLRDTDPTHGSVHVSSCLIQNGV